MSMLPLMFSSNPDFVENFLFLLLGRQNDWGFTVLLAKRLECSACSCFACAAQKLRVSMAPTSILGRFEGHESSRINTNLVTLFVKIRVIRVIIRGKNHIRSAAVTLPKSFVR